MTDTLTTTDQTTTDETTTTQPGPAQTISKTVAGKTVTLTPEQAEAFGRELDELKERVIADLGERDATYIRRMIKAQRTLEVGGRALHLLVSADGVHGTRLTNPLVEKCLGTTSTWRNPTVVAALVEKWC